jgi:hypothetical protein
MLNKELPSGSAPAAPGGKTRGDSSQYEGEKVTAAILQNFLCWPTSNNAFSQNAAG